jgi:hypothetical protein
MVYFSFLWGIYFGFKINVLNGHDFLVEESEVWIFLIKQLINELYVIRGWYALHHNEAAHKVAQLGANLLAVVRLVSRDALVHRVLGKESEVLVRIAAAH